MIVILIIAALLTTLTTQTIKMIHSFQMALVRIALKTLLNKHILTLMVLLIALKD